LANGTPEGLPPYVTGPDPRPEYRDLAVGEYRGIATLHVPPAATGLTVVEREAVVQGSDGGWPVMGTRFQLRPGEETQLVFRFSVPAGTPLRLEPSGRHEPVEWRIGDGAPVAAEGPVTVVE
jgi:hypothetical protein